MLEISNTRDLIRVLLNDVPELKHLYEEHIKDFDDLLPHVFLGDVTRFFVKQVRNGLDALDQPANRILVVFEKAMTSSEEIKEIVSVSFLENLIDDNEILGELMSIMGPELKAEIDKKIYP